VRHNHEMHEIDEKHEMAAHKMRLDSPLSADEEHLMTETIGCAIAVHKTLGPGFLESIYRRAMCVELGLREISFETEVPVRVTYREVEIPGQRLDLIVGGLIVVELKAVSVLDDVHRAQLISYLRTTRLRGGLLINFRVPILPKGLKRVVV
jgi:GxxExxY protein